MFAYILKRFLLMFPTLLGVLLLTFVVMQFVPGGPVEQYLAEAKAGTAGGGGAEGGGMGYRGAQGVDPEAAGADQGAVRLRQTGARALLCRCWASSHALTWAAAFFRTRMCGS